MVREKISKSDDDSFFDDDSSFDDDFDNDIEEEAESMFTNIFLLQITGVVVFIGVGLLSTVFMQPILLDMIPSSGYAEIISWIGGVIIGCVVSYVVTSVVGMIGMFFVGKSMF